MSGEALIALLAETGFEGAYGILIFAIPRPLGLMFGFLALSWALGPAVLLRTSIATAIAVPALASNLGDINDLVAESDVFQSALVAVREFAIGYALGMIASLPFFALQYAGAITDAFRGESDSGQQDPTGGTLQSFSTLYLVIGFSVFFASGGLWDLVGAFYRSYAVWPIDAVFPTVAPDAGILALSLLGETLMTSIIVAMPLLACLVLVELGVGVAARLGRRTNFYEMAFPAKNLSVILLLPIVAWYIHGPVSPLLFEAAEAMPILEMLLP